MDTDKQINNYNGQLPAGYNFLSCMTVPFAALKPDYTGFLDIKTYRTVSFFDGHTSRLSGLFHYIWFGGPWCKAGNELNIMLIRVRGRASH